MFIRKHLDSSLSTSGRLYNLLCSNEKYLLPTFLPTDGARTVDKNKNSNGIKYEMIL